MHLVDVKDSSSFKTNLLQGIRCGSGLDTVHLIFHTDVHHLAAEILHANYINAIEVSWIFRRDAVYTHIYLRLD
jgi:hypothetical protein